MLRSNEELKIGFLANAKRLNVALTRAKYSIVVFGDSRTIRADDQRWNILLENHCAPLSSLLAEIPVVVEDLGNRQISSEIELNSSVSKRIGAFFGMNEQKCEHLTIDFFGLKLFIFQLPRRYCKTFLTAILGSVGQHVRMTSFDRLR